MPSFNSFGKILLGAFLLDALACGVLWLFDKMTVSVKDGQGSRRRRRSISNLLDVETEGSETEMPNGAQKPSVFHMVLFFPESNTLCRFHYERAEGCHVRNCQFDHEAALLECLLSSLNKAKKTLDICIYLLTSYELTMTIKRLRERGIVVRVITDGNICDDAKSKIGHLRAAGIAIRCSPPGYLMHHKFAIIDNTILLNGSFNWTWQAITGNHENLTVTNNSALVKPYMEEFNKLWAKYDI